MASQKCPVNGKGFGLLFEMGCGKTLTAIAIMGAGYQLGYVKSALIIAPASVCSVWPQEFDDYADFPCIVRTLMGTKEKRLKELNALIQSKGLGLRAAVINYEAVRSSDILDALYLFNPDLVLCDESQRIKTHNAAQSRAIHALGDRARYKLILSGTPVQNNAVDIWSQYRFLDPSVFGTNFYAFRRHYCIMGGYEQKQIIGYRDLDTLIKKEHAIACRVTKKEALDLPEQTFQNRVVTLDAKARKLYDRLRRDSVAELESGDTITAATVLTKLLRLQQLAGGFLPGDENPRPQMVSRGKLDALADILRDYVLEGQKKLVIFARFLPEVHAIVALCDSVLGGGKTVSIYGGVRQEDRGTIVQRFQNDPETLVFVGQIDTAGTGITLTAADTCVYYSLSFNYAAYSQSLSRIHRLGQVNKCTYIHLIAEKTIDEHILSALAKKQDLARTVVDNWRQFF